MSPLRQKIDGILQLALKILGGLDWLRRGWRGRARERNYLRRRGRLSFPVVSRLCSFFLIAVAFRKEREGTRASPCFRRSYFMATTLLPANRAKGLWKNEKLSRLARAKADRAAIHLSAVSPLLDSHDTILFDGALKHFIVFRRG